MVFSSITFLFYFLPVALIVYYLVPNKSKNLILFITSMVFYFFGEPTYVCLMLFSILSTYVFGILIDKNKETKYAKIYLALAIIVSLGLLTYFKYIDFLIENINLFLKHKMDALGVVLPIGISFYTFQMISYLVDVYRGDAKAQKSFLKLATYVALFPQLIAGPIVRYVNIENQLEKREHSLEKFSLGIRRFVIGLAKKVLIANVVGELINVFDSNQEQTILFYWMYAIANMLQIYFDFSGYSDMAIGLGKMFGFEIQENFNYPYVATSITDFWRRWHISLSSWFKDYVYIPLGGNRVSVVKWIRNILCVWLLTGLWHGASWNFILWGLYFGVILLVEKLFIKKYLDKMPKVLNNIYVLIIVMISFIIFSGSSTEEITNNILGLLPLGDNELINSTSLYYFKSYFVTFFIGIIGATPIAKKVISKFNIKMINKLEPIILIILLIVSTSYIIDGSFNPFLYFRF